MDPVLQALLDIRVKLLFSNPFFGVLILRMDPKDASKWCKTLTTDGKHIFYNREYIKSMTKDELTAAMAHLMLHSAFDHLGRRGGKDKKLWDAATDYVVNSVITDEKIGKLPKDSLYSTKYKDLAADEIYRQLKEEVEDGTLDPESLSGGFDEHLDLGDDAKDKAKGKGDGEGEEGDEEVEGDGGEPPPSPEDGKAPEDPDPGRITGVDYADEAPVYTEEELIGLKMAMKTALINAIQSNSGNAPAAVQRLVEDFTTPTIDWKELLANTMQSALSKEDYSFDKPSKRSYCMGKMEYILPSQKNGQTIDICVSLDTSGSISNAIFTAFLSEVKGILEQYDDYRLHIWCIDAAIYNPQVFTPDNVGAIDEYKPAGGGGNDFPLNWKYMRDNEITPELFVVFSDGYPCGSWGDPDYCDTIFVIRNDWDKSIEAPFGLTVYMDDDLGPDA